jgi:hypothetical protein
LRPPDAEEKLQTNGRKSHKKKKSTDTELGNADEEDIDELAAEETTPKKRRRSKAKDVKSEPVVKAEQDGDGETPSKPTRKPRKKPQKKQGAEEAVEEEIAELAGVGPEKE